MKLIAQSEINDVAWRACDTLRNPRLTEGDHLMRFDIVVANPHFSLGQVGAGRR